MKNKLQRFLVACVVATLVPVAGFSQTGGADCRLISVDGQQFRFVIKQGIKFFGIQNYDADVLPKDSSNLMPVENSEAASIYTAKFSSDRRMSFSAIQTLRGNVIERFTMESGAPTVNYEVEYLYNGFNRNNSPSVRAIKRLRGINSMFLIGSRRYVIGEDGSISQVSIRLNKNRKAPKRSTVTFRSRSAGAVLDTCIML